MSDNCNIETIKNKCSQFPKIDYEKECARLNTENDKLHETIKDMQRHKKTMDCASMNYEAAYRILQFECQHISDENESLKKALVALALKL